MSVALYNPTSSALGNVQVFAAISDIDLFTDVSFAGGDSGDVSVVAADLSGGTPFLSDGSSMPSHGVFPAYFASYGVGDLPTGASGVRTIWVNVTGDFSGGLLVHLDYSAEDANGAAVTGPFEADMNLFENGEAAECEPPTLSLSGTPSSSSPKPGDLLTVGFETTLSGGDEAPFFGTTDSTHATGWSPALEERVLWEADDEQEFPDGKLVERFNVSFLLPDLLLASDRIEITSNLTGTVCDGTVVTATHSLSLTVGGDASGDVHSASWWEKQLEKTEKGKKKAAYNESTLLGFLGAVALHSDLFTFGDWDGTAPTGVGDEGWLDIDSLDEAIDVLEGKSGDSKKVRGAERQALALWLNVASGALNLDTLLAVPEDCDDDDDDECDDDEDEDEDWEGSSTFKRHTGLDAPGNAFDTVGEILAFAEAQVSDWSDGSGASKADLKLAKNLCKAVNKGWLVPA